MLSCPGCAYLVPAAWEACKRCGAQLSALAGAPTPAFAVAAGTTAVAARPRAHPSRPVPAPFTIAAAPLAADLRPCDRGSGRRVDLTAPAPALAAGRRRSRAASWVVIVASLLVVAGTGYVAWDKVANPPVPAELRPWLRPDGGVTYTPVSGVSVSLPAAPLEQSVRVSVGRATEVGAAVDEATAGAHVAGVVVLVVPPSALGGDPDGPAKAAAVAASRAAGFALDVVTATTFQGRPAIAADISRSGSEGRALVVLDGSRIVGVYVLGTKDGGAGFGRIRSSLQLG